MWAILTSSNGYRRFVLLLSLLSLISLLSILLIIGLPSLLSLLSLLQAVFQLERNLVDVLLDYATKLQGKLNRIKK